MKINLSPVRSDASLTVTKDGDTLILNGETFDFSELPDGATLPADAVATKWISGQVERINGELHLTLRLPHGKDASRAARFPSPIVSPADGALELPK